MLFQLIDEDRLVTVDAAEQLTVGAAAPARILAGRTRVNEVRLSMLDSQYLAGSSASGGHSAISRHSGGLPSALREMSRFAGQDP